MESYIHFTKNANTFDLDADGGDAISQECGGLFVYKYDSDFPVAQRAAEWGYRDAVVISVPDGVAQLEQTDPLGDDETRDEYVIPADAFDRCDYWKIEY